MRYALARAPASATGRPAYLLSGYRRVDLQIAERQPVVLELGFGQPQLSYLPASPLSVEVAVDQQPPQRVALTVGGAIQRQRVALSAGQHQISIRIVAPCAGHYVFLYVDELTADGRRRSWDRQPSADPERFFHVATPRQPVQFRLTGPAWVRVEQLLGGQLQRRDLTMATGTQDVQLRAGPDGEPALFRIVEFRHGGAVPPLPPVYQATAESAPARRRWLTEAIGSAAANMPQWANAGQVDLQRASCTLPEMHVLLPPGAPPRLLGDVDSIPLGGHEDGTWGFGTGLFQRRAVEEGDLAGSGERFLQTLVSYDTFQPDRSRYVSTQGIVRLRDSSGPTLGARHETWQALNDLLATVLPSLGYLDDFEQTPVARWTENWQLHSEYAGYAQWPTDPLPGYQERTEGSLSMRSQLYRRIDLTAQSYHVPSVTVLSRWLSLDQTSYLPRRVDQDVFTPFKSTHRNALYLSDTWTYAFCETQRVWARPALFSNDDLTIFAPDHVSMMTGISTLWNTLDLELAYRYARFFDDGDRRTATDQHLVYFDALLDRWQHSGRLAELAVNVRHVLNEGDTSAFATLTLFSSRGRGYRDRHPSTIGFRAQRERAAFPAWLSAEMH
jgi:hypothetical protein